MAQEIIRLALARLGRDHAFVKDGLGVSRARAYQLISGDHPTTEQIPVLHRLLELTPDEVAELYRLQGVDLDHAGSVAAAP